MTPPTERLKREAEEWAEEQFQPNWAQGVDLNSRARLGAELGYEAGALAERERYEPLVAAARAVSERNKRRIFTAADAGIYAALRAALAKLAAAQGEGGGE